MKNGRFFIPLISFLIAGGISLTLVSLWVPPWLVGNLEKALDKDVHVEKLAYRFPLGLEMHGVQVIEKGRFEGETSLEIEKIELDFNSASFITSEGIQLAKVGILRPRISLRKYEDKFFHAFSGKNTLLSGLRPLNIQELTILEGSVQWVDYDIIEGGFVVEAREVGMSVRDLGWSADSSPTEYEIKGWISQGRRQSAARFDLSGSTNWRTWDTTASLETEGFWIPYFRPYYEGITAAYIEEGLLQMISTAEIKSKRFSSHARATFRRLRFSKFEPNHEILGLEADSVLSMIQSYQGVIPMDVQIETVLNDESLSVRETLRSSIQNSLKALVLANVTNTVEETVERAGETTHRADEALETDDTQPMQTVLEW